MLTVERLEQELIERERACNSFNGKIISVTIFSNTKLREISVYCPINLKSRFWCYESCFLLY